MNIAIVGATGNVGRKILEVLEKKNFLIDNLYLVASSKSAGSKLKFKGREIEVENLENFDFSKSDIAFFSAGGKISEKYAPIAAKNLVVIDNSSFFRMDPDVPLIVPQVNSDEIRNIKKNTKGRYSELIDLWIYPYQKRHQQLIKNLQIPISLLSNLIHKPEHYHFSGPYQSSKRFL